MLSGKISRFGALAVLSMALSVSLACCGRQDSEPPDGLAGLSWEYRTSGRDRDFVFRVDETPMDIDLGTIPPDAILRMGLLTGEGDAAAVTATLLTKRDQVVITFEAKSTEWSLVRQELDPLGLTGKRVTLRLEGTPTPFWVGPCEVMTGEPEKPNVLIYLIDTLRQDHMGLYGYGLDTSPHLDVFAQDALTFTHLTPTSSWTRPSVASLLTGTYPNTHGARQRSSIMRKGMPSLAEAFNQGGYETHAILCNGNVGPHLNMGNRFHHLRWGVDGQMESDGPLVNELIRVMEFAKGRPWLVFGHAVGPHSPYVSTEEHFQEFCYERAQMSSEGLQELLRGCKLDKWGRRARSCLLYRNENMPEPEPSRTSIGASIGETFGVERLKQVIVDAYDANIASSDEQFGRLVGWLKDEGLYDNTIVIVLSDHGEEFWEHGGFLHGKTLYEEMLRVPFLVKMPRNAYAGEIRTGIVSMTDIAPTLVELLGLPPQPHFQGESFVPILEDNVADDRLAFASLLDERPQRNHNLRTTKDKKDKLIQDLNKDSSEWFDLEKDPGEEDSVPAPPDASRLETYIEEISKLGMSGLYLMVRADIETPTEYVISISGLNLQGHTVRYAPKDAVLARTDDALEWRLSFPGPKGKGRVIDKAALLHLEAEGPGDFRIVARAGELPLEPQEYHFLSLDITEDGTATVSFPDLIVEQPPVDDEKPPEDIGLYLWYVPSSKTISTEELSEEIRANLEALGYLQS